MITIISGTNRKNSRTNLIANVYASFLEKKGISFKIIDLADLPADFVHNNMYAQKSSSFQAFEEEFLVSCDKFILVFPEYNGSFPGILKLLIDGSDIKQCFYGKKALLTGISAGRAGCLRGLDHLTNCLNYIKMEVLPNKLPISSIESLLDNDELQDENTLQSVEQQLNEFLDF